MSVGELLLFGNVSQPPFCNNLYPPLRAFQKLFRTTLIEPSSLPGFVSTGGARPALIPDDSVFSHTDPPPQAVVCLGGALHLSARARRMFPSDTIFGGFALSDPQGLEASLAIAPEFDLFYTQDAQTLPALLAAPAAGTGAPIAGAAAPALASPRPSPRPRPPSPSPEPSALPKMAVPTTRPLAPPPPPSPVPEG